VVTAYDSPLSQAIRELYPPIPDDFDCPHTTRRLAGVWKRRQPEREIRVCVECAIYLVQRGVPIERVER
jgi:hypothetical protein